METLKNYFLNLNVFETTTDENQNRLNKVSTRVYLMSIVIILTLLGFYTWATAQTTLIHIKNPSRHQLEKLPQNSQCPCSQISISYGDFVSLEAKLHQVCSSDFVSDRWINSLFFGLNSTYFYPIDFRTIGNAQFQALAAFCRLSLASIKQNLKTFYQNKIVSTHVLSENIFQNQIDASIQQFKSVIANNFQIQLKLQNIMTIANRLFSALPIGKLSIYLSMDDVNFSIFNIPLYLLTRNGTSYSCLSQDDFMSPSYIFDRLAPASLYDPISPRSLAEIAGLGIHCFADTAMRFSTLECFFNQTCVDQLVSFLATDQTFNALKLNETSRFEYNLTVESIINELMIENWTVNVSHSKYYEQCAPKTCTYSVNQRHDFTFILVQLISLLGGLTTLLGFIVPTVINFLKRRKNTTPAPIIPCT